MSSYRFWKLDRFVQDHPDHLKHFIWMHKRALGGVSVGSEFFRGLQGFKAFVCEIGSYPSEMTRPSVGRRDHSKGYVVGNFRWQEFGDNSNECALRNNHRKGEAMWRFLEPELRADLLSLRAQKVWERRRQNELARS